MLTCARMAVKSKTGSKEPMRRFSRLPQKVRVEAWLYQNSPTRSRPSCQALEQWLYFTRANSLKAEHSQHMRRSQTITHRRAYRLCSTMKNKCILHTRGDHSLEGRTSVDDLESPFPSASSTSCEEKRKKEASVRKMSQN